MLFVFRPGVVQKCTAYTKFQWLIGQSRFVLRIFHRSVPKSFRGCYSLWKIMDAMEESAFHVTWYGSMSIDIRRSSFCIYHFQSHFQYPPPSGSSGALRGFEASTPGPELLRPSFASQRLLDPLAPHLEKRNNQQKYGTTWNNYVKFIQFHHPNSQGFLFFYLSWEPRIAVSSTTKLRSSEAIQFKPLLEISSDLDATAKRECARTSAVPLATDFLMSFVCSPKQPTNLAIRLVQFL